METQQQTEALRYFSEHAEDWKKSAFGGNPMRVNIIQQRNNFVLDVFKQRPAIEKTLDVGCGTGDLVCGIAQYGTLAVGVDFAPEMVAIAKSRAEEERLENATFYCASIFDFPLQENEYDLISASGFIEYISLQELDTFLDRVSSALKPGGSFVVGSRNRLFNLFSLNTFTMQELAEGNVEALLKEAAMLAMSTTLKEFTALDIVPAPLQKPGTIHSKTGIGVSTRYQFTPLQLINAIKSRNLSVHQLYPIHIHATPPAFKEQFPQVHTALSNGLQNYAGMHLSLVPFSSSFMLHSVKP